MRIALLIAIFFMTVFSHQTDATPAVKLASANCVSQFTRDQFVGGWREADSPGVYALNADGGMTQNVENQSYSGTWEFVRWGDTAGTPSSGNESACVLQLEINFRSGPIDSIYFPLSITGPTLKLSYVDRGDTIVWTRT